MQDLDIRGAGNMLGAEQSGFIADVGYETYQKILEEAVDELKTEEFSDIYASEKSAGDVFVRETFIESDLELLFPPAYIPSDSERVSIYRELDKIEDDKGLEGFVSRLIDRFGAIPQEGEELIRVVHLRRLGKQLGFDKIVLKRGVMNINLVRENNSPYYQSNSFGKLLAYIQKYPKNCELKETSDKRSLIIKNIRDVRAACLVLDEIQH
jgi:transcription-repair coupling factor (superfamily II helicase)